MKKLFSDYSTVTQQSFLIEHHIDIHLVIDQLKSVIDVGHLPTEVVMAKHVRFENGPLPEAYPYAIVVNCDDERNTLRVSAIDLASFNNSGKLYEFRLKKTDLTSPYTSREFDYQVPASSAFDALFKLGQTYNRDDEYTLEVLHIGRVN
ncbi:hypothetical protein PHABIO_434 [Pseudomonas phage Phabio]|uniref:Uncharacterized protein n=1 Tax=Pseudomonas phage Phabio TaxID=2006668 RepID=A0A1Y0SX28_9CAUD|nr:hypothetical protein MZD05_gp434 [Pseudomonas phage Phabio]ARV77065.1 hypothetical protein PHABIO_434 [Pseudomonas phage Phabio]